jgi:predicted GH43/DUF377 family glycosyl hydrolase
MTGLDAIKFKLKRLFAKTAIQANHKPLKIYQRGPLVYYQYNDVVTNETFELESKNGFDFTNARLVSRYEDHFPQLPNDIRIKAEKNSKEFIFFGDRKIQLAVINEYGHSSISEVPIIAEAYPVELSNVFIRQDGLLIFYFKKEIKKGKLSYSSFIALTDKNDPVHVLWKLDQPIWEQDKNWAGEDVRPLGSILLKNTIVSYWLVDSKLLYAVSHAGFLYDPKNIKNLKLDKHLNNPILAPNEDNGWEAFTTLNPAAFKADGKVHILYRAQGYDYISTVGYARSQDGATIEYRSPKPIYAPHEGFETNTSNSANPKFISAGGYGGCEDPRVTQIEDRVFMTYVAFDGWSPPRVALTSIHIDDFLNERWNWEKPVLITKPGVVDKSGCLLPEKINDKYVFFHRVFPNIQIDFVDDLNFDGKTKFLKGEHEIKIRPDKWDSRKIGAGAPPIKTKDGWLLIYYGVDDKDDGKYLIGAMLLDLKDPTKVLHRTDSPIIEPEEHYEMNGFKPGIVYPCGAVVLKNQLMVYYGGADSHVCVATADLNKFIEDLMLDKTPKLEGFEVKEVFYS